jgi:hypothetical protein
MRFKILQLQLYFSSIHATINVAHSDLIQNSRQNPNNPMFLQLTGASILEESQTTEERERYNE